MSSGGQFIAVLVLIAVGGGMAYWTFLDWRERKRARQRAEMERWAEPSSFGRTHDFRPEDELTQPPLLPKDYRQWQTKK